MSETKKLLDLKINAKDIIACNPCWEDQRVRNFCNKQGITTLRDIAECCEITDTAWILDQPTLVSRHAQSAIITNLEKLGICRTDYKHLRLVSYICNKHPCCFDRIHFQYYRDNLLKERQQTLLNYLTNWKIED